MILANKYLVLFLLVCIFTTKLISQDIKPGKPNPLDKQFTPSNNKSLEADKGKSRSVSSNEKNFIKWNSTLMARRIISFQYERELLDNFNVYLGLGSTFGRDGIMAFFHKSSSSGGGTTSGSNLLNGEIKSQITSGDIMAYGDFSGPSLFYSIGAKVFYESSWGNYSNYGNDNLHYIEFSAKFYSHNFDIGNKIPDVKANKSDEYYEIRPGSNKTNLSHQTYSLNYGIIIESSRGFSHEIYNGIGIRFTNQDIYASDPLLGTQTITEYYKTGKREQVSSFMYTFGYLLCFGF